MPRVHIFSAKNVQIVLRLVTKTQKHKKKNAHMSSSHTHQPQQQTSQVKPKRVRYLFTKWKGEMRCFTTLRERGQDATKEECKLIAPIRNRPTFTTDKAQWCKAKKVLALSLVFKMKVTDTGISSF